MGGVEKGAVISEIQADLDNADSLLREGMYLSALGTSKYHPVLGTEENIRNATIEDLKKFYDKYYCGSNVVLCLSGDLTKAEIKKTVKKFDRLRDQKAPKRKPFDFKFNYRRSSFKRRELEQSIVYWLKPVVEPRTTRTKTALNIAVACLSQYMFEELRERRGLVYGASAGLNWDIPGNLFMFVEAATDSDRLKKTQRETEKALKNFIEKGLTAERIRNTIVSYQYNAAEAKESSSNSNEWLWDGWKENIKEDPFKFQAGIFNTMTSETVKNAARNALSGPWKFGKMVEKA